MDSEIVENVGEFVSKQCDEFSYSTEKSGNDVVGDSAEKKIEDEIVPDMNLASDGKFSIEDAKFEANDSPRSIHLDINSFTTATAASDMLSPSFSLHSSPSLGALNDLKNQTLYLTPYSEDECSGRKLIRSNSYTLDTPSPMLLKLMKENGINANQTSPPKVTASSQPSLTLKDKLPPVKQAWAGTTTKIAVKRSPSLIDVKSTKPATARKSISPASSVREQQKKLLSKPKGNFPQRKCASARNQESVLRSIYDSGLSNRSTVKPKKSSIAVTAPSGKLTARVEKPATAPAPIPVPVSAPVSAPATAPASAPAKPDPNAVDFEKILKMIEEQHSTQMNALIERQKEEQKRMQEEFARQQENLVKQISHLVLPASPSANVNVLSKPISRYSIGSTKMDNNVAGYDSTDYDELSANVSRDHNGNQSNRSSRIDRRHPTPESLKCMRRLVYYDDNQMVSSDLCESTKYPERPQRDIDIPLSSSEEEEVFRIQNEAATIITAYAKGYLTRRLFKTVKVQNIVKTIKDTLLFILDIHFENPIENDSPADLKLKTHLIQQVRTRFPSANRIEDIYFILILCVVSLLPSADVRMLQLA